MKLLKNTVKGLIFLAMVMAFVAMVISATDVSYTDLYEEIFVMLPLIFVMLTLGFTLLFNSNKTARIVGYNLLAGPFLAFIIISVYFEFEEPDIIVVFIASIIFCIAIILRGVGALLSFADKNEFKGSFQKKVENTFNEEFDKALKKENEKLDVLKKWQKLYESGAVTKEEFDAKCVELYGKTFDTK
jgi:hypothetical protein